jgi:hypothetical protein
LLGNPSINNKINYEDLQQPKTLYLTTFGKKANELPMASGKYTKDLDYYAALRVNYGQHPQTWWFPSLVNGQPKYVRLINPETLKYIDVPLLDWGPNDEQDQIIQKAGGQVIEQQSIFLM